MTPRILTGGDPDEASAARERARDEDHWREVRLERDRYAPARTCSMCHRSIDAVPDCPICGDHLDMADAA